MKYYSTKDKACAHAFSLREAVQAGLAPDGGVFVPVRIPQADMAVAERLAGDLVNFSYGGGDISHVGIYLGGGAFIHATSNGGVKSSYFDGYYSSTYVGAVRILAD